MQRYFALNNTKPPLLSKEDEHHLLKVMRASKGEKIEIVVDEKCFLYEINSTKPLESTEIRELTDDRELANHVTLYYCLAKGDKVDFVIQKAVELGIAEIVLIQSERSIVRLKNDELPKKIERYQSILKAAAMQSKRLTIPKLARIIDLRNFGKGDCKMHNFVAYEDVAGSTKNFKRILENIKPRESISIMVGPEGGFAPHEIKRMNEFGFISVSLGKRILRSETAAISALTIIAFILEG
jgi:16S rRNA (uracil1498-N3)-methyltransferase